MSFDYFSERSDLYASARPTYPPKLFDYLSEQCPEHQRAWDCATGSGQAAVALAEIFVQVDATDLSREQLAHSKPHPGVTYSEQPAEQTNFADHSFDLVCVAQALHWFDFDRFWPEVQRVLKPGGLFAAWTYSWFTINPEIDAIVQSQLFDVIESDWAPQNKIAWHGYHEVQFPFEPLQTPAFEFTNRWTLAQLLAYVETWSATRRHMKERGDAFLVQLRASLQRSWGDPESTRAIKTDFYTLFGINE